MRILDRYVLDSFFRIFGICVLGVPFIFIVIDLADRVDTYLAEGATGTEILLHYVYQFPYQSLLAFPIAALLAAVFSVSSMTRHFETTAAKAGGISFYRLTAPLLLAGFAISLISLVLTEFVPATNRMAEDALGQEEARTETVRDDFVFRGKRGRVYRVQKLDSEAEALTGVRVDREGTGFGYPTYNITAATGAWITPDRRWVLRDGRLRFFPELETTRTFRFDELWQRQFRESPRELLADPKDPDEMGYFELGRFIDAIQRSGGTARELIVERALKVAFPFTCFIIVLFGTPLAHATRRGGAALSVGIALATTILFLMLIRISQAMGAGGVVPPRLAAWIPNAIFLVAGLWLMRKVRT
jgi:lipopolysaccharide export system permease protein